MESCLCRRARVGFAHALLEVVDECLLAKAKGLAWIGVDLADACIGPTDPEDCQSNDRHLDNGRFGLVEEERCSSDLDGADNRECQDRSKLALLKQDLADSARRDDRLRRQLHEDREAGEGDGSEPSQDLPGRADDCRGVFNAEGVSVREQRDGTSRPGERKRSRVNEAAPCKRSPIPRVAPNVDGRPDASSLGEWRAISHRTCSSSHREFDP